MSQDVIGMYSLFSLSNPLNINFLIPIIIISYISKLLLPEFLCIFVKLIDSILTQYLKNKSSATHL